MALNTVVMAKTEKNYSSPLLEWFATYGDNYEDLRASMFNDEMMQEFADFQTLRAIEYCKKYKLSLIHI